MKSKYTIEIFIFFILVLSGIIFSSFMVRRYLNKSAESLIKRLEQTEYLISHDNWIEAASELSKAEKEWDKSLTYWSLFTNHHEIDSISNLFNEATSYVRFYDSEMSITSITSLKNFIIHIPELEKISLKNII